MEEQFFNLYESQSSLCLEVGHNQIADWCVAVYDKQGKGIKDGVRIVATQGCDRSLAFARAYVELAEYLSENRGGY